jgi:Fe-S oxidoreductase/nitrate reductase gamma subunit
MYLFFAVSLIVAGNGIYQRIQLWSHGKSDSSRFLNIAQRLPVLFRYVLLQRKTNRAKTAMGFHSAIFYGFLALLFTTTMVFIDYDLGIKIYHGNFYLFVTVLSDTFGFLLFCGTSYAIYRRKILKPDLLHSSPVDFILLYFLLLLVIQGFTLEGLRIAATNDQWALYSPVGYIFSFAFWGLSLGSLTFLHFALWWFHTITVFVFIGIIPYTKFFHIISSSANLFFAEIDKPKGALKSPGDIELLLETADENFSLGIDTIEDLTWKQRLDLDACTSCGRCQEICPAYNSDKALSPKWLILDTRNHMLYLQSKNNISINSPHSILEPLLSLLQKLDSFLLKILYLPVKDPENYSSAFVRSNNKKVNEAALQLGTNSTASLAGEVMNSDVFWACTTCRACMEVCPVSIEHVDLITEVRRNLSLIKGEVPSDALNSLKAIETRGNPFGPSDDRFSWATGLDVPLIKEGDQVDILYWVGCISAYDKRKQSITKSMVKILNAANLSWGMLGNLESCSGDPARRLGEENIFQGAAKKNSALLRSISFKTIVANCPHCFNTIKNEYSQFGGIGDGVNVIHHTQLISELIENKKLSLKNKLDDNMTFHDPCYLGRYNDVYDEPRDILVSIGNKSVIELDDSKQRSMCCGAGGGHFWMDLNEGKRINTMRMEQVIKTNVNTVATACPFCLQMLEDGNKLVNKEDTIRVRDIAELVAEAL